MFQYGIEATTRVCLAGGDSLGHQGQAPPARRRSRPGPARPRAPPCGASGCAGPARLLSAVPLAGWSRSVVLRLLASVVSGSVQAAVAVARAARWSSITAAMMSSERPGRGRSRQAPGPGRSPAPGAACPRSRSRRRPGRRTRSMPLADPVAAMTRSASSSIETCSVTAQVHRPAEGRVGLDQLDQGRHDVEYMAEAADLVAGAEDRQRLAGQRLPHESRDDHAVAAGLPRPDRVEQPDDHAHAGHVPGRTRSTRLSSMRLGLGVAPARLQRRADDPVVVLAQPDRGVLAVDLAGRGGQQPGTVAAGGRRPRSRCRGCWYACYPACWSLMTKAPTAAARWKTQSAPAVSR